MRKQARTTEEKLALVNRISLFVLVLSLLTVYSLVAWRMTGTLTPTLELLDGHAAVRFLDVGQGDCTLVTHGGRAVLVDAGPGNASDATAELVHAYAPKIDAFFVTHPHEDHMGGAAEVLSRSRVGTLYLGPGESGERFYENALAGAGERGTGIVRLEGPSVFVFGDITVEVLDTFGCPWDDLNDASLTLRVTVDGLSVLIGGDAGEAEETWLVEHGCDLRADILQINHHGSASSTTERFLDCVSPRIAVISCGKNNDYGHPTGAVLERLEIRGIAVRRTDREGTVVIRGGT